MYMYNKNCRAKKWWRRLFLHLLDLSIVNACILYNYQRDKRTCMPLLEFRMEVAKGLLINHTYRTDSRHPAPQADLPLRLTANTHFPQRIEKKQAVVGDQYVRYADPEKYDHSFSAVPAKLHYTHTHAWQYTIPKQTISSCNNNL